MNPGNLASITFPFVGILYEQPANLVNSMREEWP
jgi:hypothetical protein